MNRIPAGNLVTDSKKIPPLPKIPQTGLFSHAQGSWHSAKSAGDRQADFSRGKSVAFCLTWPSTECIAMCTGAGYGIVVQVKGDVLVAAISDLPGLWLGFSRGDAASRDTLLSLYYEEFRKIARRMLTTDSSRMRLQPTDLVHEAVVRIISGNGVAVRDQNHLLSLAARVMRVTLIDEVRKYKAAKRGDVVTLWPDAEEAMPPLEIEAFDETLYRLAKVEPEGARIVELRFYAGMTLPEISAALELSESTVQRRWRTARAWMIKELQSTD